MARKKRSGSKGLPLGANIAIIAVLAVIATVLSYLALQSVNEPDPQGFSTTGGTVSESPVILDSTELTEPEADPAAAASEQVSLVAPSRLLALDGSLGVRAEVGECSTPGSIEFSTDGGQNWLPSAAFEATSATQVLRILPSNGGTTFIVALNEACTPQIYSTADNGLNWGGPLSAVGTWYLDPASPSALGAPGGAKTISCEARALSTVTDREVGVLCADGSIITTTNGGESWSKPIQIDGVVALSSSTSKLVVTRNSDMTCDGFRILEIKDSQVRKIGCASSRLLVDPVSQDSVAVAGTGEKVLLWFEETILVSLDGGAEWSNYAGI